MAEAFQAPQLTAGSVGFALERFERAEDGRLEIDGRWSGVRGRRFIRPSLTVGTDGTRQRFLADLEHKPWAPEEGEPWHAVFAVPEGDLGDAELAVAPDIALRLPPLGRPTRRRARGSKATTAPRRRRETPRRPEVAREREAGGERAGANAPVADLEAAWGEVGTLRAELEKLRTEVEGVREQRDTALAGRDAALAERDTALTERDTALTECDAALAEREAALAAVSTAHAERVQALTERDAVLVELHVAVAERDAARAERNAAVRDRTAAQFELEDLKELQRSEPAPRGPEWAGAGTIPPPVSPLLPAGRRNVGWPLRALAVGTFLVLVVVLAIILRLV